MTLLFWWTISSMNDPLDVVALPIQQEGRLVQPGPRQCSDPLACVPASAEKNAELWTDRLAASLTAAEHGFLKEFIESLDSYASDCSGANAPWHALVDLQSMVQSRKKPKHKFASEAPGRMGDCGRLFMTLNHAPEIMYSDMLHRPARRNERGEVVLQSYCSYRQRMVDLPATGMYVFGSECQDQSSANTRCKKPVEAIVTDSSGMATRTMHGSINYVTVYEPPVFIMEYLIRNHVIMVIMKMFSKLPDYILHVFKVNNIGFGLRGTRPRMYIVGLNVKKGRLRKPMTNWGPFLAKVSQSLCLGGGYLSLENHVLMNESEQYVRTKLMKAAERCKLGKYKTCGGGWEKQFKLHMSVRNHLQAECHRRGLTISVPSCKDMVASVRSTPWGATLTARECDVVGLNQFACDIMGIDWRHLHFMWDISTEISYARKKHPLAAATLPCLLCNHKVWATSLRQYMLGKGDLARTRLPRHQNHTGRGQQCRQARCRDTPGILAGGRADDTEEEPCRCHKTYERTVGESQRQHDGHASDRQHHCCCWRPLSACSDNKPCNGCTTPGAQAG